MQQFLKSLTRDLGPLRVAMAVTVALLVIAAPFALQPTNPNGWAIWPTVVAPALFVIFIFVLPLDVTMTLVFRADKEGAERARLTRVLTTELVLIALLVAAWIPFVLGLLDQV